MNKYVSAIIIGAVAGIAGGILIKMFVCPSDPNAQSFNDGGTVTDVTVNSNVSTGLGTWRYLGGRSYSSFTKFIVYSEFGPNTFNGIETLTRQIEFKNADEYTVTATGRVYDPDGNLTNTVCATATATRVKQQETAGP